VRSFCLSVLCTHMFVPAVLVEIVRWWRFAGDSAFAKFATTRHKCHCRALRDGLCCMDLNVKESAEALRIIRNDLTNWCVTLLDSSKFLACV